MSRMTDKFNGIKNSFQEGAILFVEYAAGQDAYEVILMTDTNTVQSINKNQTIATKEGEDRVAAILRAYPEAVTSIHRFKNNQQNDGVNGEPAFRVFRPSGEPMLTMHYKNGVKQQGQRVNLRHMLEEGRQSRK